MKLSVKNGQQYQIFLVLCEHLYISNPYIIEAKVICNKTAAFIYYWGVLSFPLWGTGRIIQKMTKSLPSRVLPSPKCLFLPHKNLPYCYLKWESKFQKKAIKILSNKMNQSPYCSPHFNNNKQ